MIDTNRSSLCYAGPQGTGPLTTFCILAKLFDTVTQVDINASQTMQLVLKPTCQSDLHPRFKTSLSLTCVPIDKEGFQKKYFFYVQADGKGQ